MFSFEGRRGLSVTNWACKHFGRFPGLLWLPVCLRLAFDFFFILHFFLFSGRRVKADAARKAPPLYIHLRTKTSTPPSRNTIQHKHAAKAAEDLPSVFDYSCFCLKIMWNWFHNLCCIFQINLQNLRCFIHKKNKSDLHRSCQVP